MKNLLFALMLAYGTLAGNRLCAQYIYISSTGITRLMRFDVMAAQWSIAPQDSLPRKAAGIYLNNEVKLLSATKLGKQKFSIYDAFYFNIALGRMSSEPQVNREEVEGRFSTMTQMGYLVMAGYRNETWGALAGVDLRWQAADVGRTQTPQLYAKNMFNHNRALMLRGEYQLLENNRLVAVATLGMGGTPAHRPPYQCVRLLLQLGKESRWWLLGQYSHQSVESWSNMYGTLSPKAGCQQVGFGFHLGFLP